ncbi:TPA: hypothetical protein ACG0AX_003636 [Elizabethkingia anophelis]
MIPYIISYDLNKTGQDYKTLKEKIEELANGYWHHLDSTWIIFSSKTAKQICSELKKCIDSNDELLVVEITKNADWIGFNKSGTDWLEKHIIK